MFFVGVQGQFDMPSHCAVISLVDIFYSIFFNCETKNIHFNFSRNCGFSSPLDKAKDSKPPFSQYLEVDEGKHCHKVFPDDPHEKVNNFHSDIDQLKVRH